MIGTTRDVLTIFHSSTNFAFLKIKISNLMLLISLFPCNSSSLVFDISNWLALFIPKSVYSRTNVAKPFLIQREIYLMLEVSKPGIAERLIHRTGVFNAIELKLICF